MSALRRLIRSRDMTYLPRYLKVAQKLEAFVGVVDVQYAAMWGGVVVGTVLWFSQPWDYFRSLLSTDSPKEGEVSA